MAKSTISVTSVDKNRSASIIIGMAAPKQLGANLRDVQIAFGKVFGMTNAEIGAAIMTPEHPTGVSERTILNRLVENRPFIDELVRWGAALKRDRQLEVKEFTREAARAELETMLGISMAQLRQMISDGDKDAVFWNLEQVLGKANQVHKHEGDVNVNHRMIWQPQHLLAKIDTDIAESQALLGALPDGIAEGELVETS